MSEDVIVTMRDVRAVHGCAWGTRRWLKRHNLDHVKFFKEGLPASLIAATGDAMALDVVEAARGREQ